MIATNLAPPAPAVDLIKNTAASPESDSMNLIQKSWVATKKEDLPNLADNADFPHDNILNLLVSLICSDCFTGC